MTPKLKVVQENEVVPEDHVVYVVNTLPKEAHDVKAGAYVNDIGGKTMYFVWPTGSTNHESGHWLGLFHPKDYISFFKGLGPDAVKLVRSIFGEANIMDHEGDVAPLRAEGVVPFQFYMAYKLYQKGFLNHGDNKYSTDFGPDPAWTAKIQTAGAKIIEEAYKVSQTRQPAQPSSK